MLPVWLVSAFIIVGYAEVTNISITDKLTVWLYAPNIARITTLPDQVIETPSANSRIVSYVPPSAIPYTVANPDSNTMVIKTSSVSISCNKQSNLVTFYDINDENMSMPILTERNKTFTEITDTASHNATYTVLQEWQIATDTTALFGWGEYQNGFTNYIGSTVRCEPFNTEACVPMFITNSGYGVYWDNLGASTLNSLNQKATPSNVSIANGTSFGAPIYGEEFNALTDCVWQNLTIPFTASNVDGHRDFFADFAPWYSFGASKAGQLYLEFWVERADGSTQMIDMYNYTNNIPSSLALQPFYMSAGEKVTISLMFQCFNQVPTIYYREPEYRIDIQSIEASFIDYYFIYAPPDTYQSPVNQPSLDGIIQGYRMLTEDAPLYELSNYGFWQCKQHYKNQFQVLAVAEEYRQRQLPVDAIVQDWHYWGPNQNWGPQWDRTSYPDPAGLVKQLHAINFYFMVSVWSKFGTNATCLAYLQSQESKTGNIEIIPGTANSSMPWFDPYNKQAQQDYYACIKSTMFDIGVDAIWSDATEPEGFPNYNQLLDNGRYSGNALFSPYSLQVIQAIQQGLNADQPNKRVFDLTRSTFAGQSKTGGAIWSGDTTASYDTLRRQITAALSLQSAGNPYWSQDIGGFFRPSCNYYCWWYLQLLIRWFQYGAFAPIFRVHGNGVNTAYWNYGPVVLQDVELIDNLRYRLLPYIYSTAYYVTSHGYTMQRSLLFDFYDDVNVFNKSTQFMFGPYLLVSPVFTYDNTTDIYVPAKYKKWYDFWSGETVNGGQYMQNVVVPLIQIPLHVHEGSIVIMGPFSQWANQYYPWNELEVRLYGGANASFVYFNDDGKDRLSLKNNEFCTILFEWIDEKKQLNVGARQGSYKGMANEIKLNIVLVSQGHGVGVNITQNPDKTVSYTGKALIVTF